MKEKLREHYFPALKLILVVGLEIYCVADEMVITGAVGLALLLLAFFLAVSTCYELTEKKYRRYYLPFEWVLLMLLVFVVKRELILLAVLVIQDTKEVFSNGEDNQVIWYVLPYSSLIWIPGEKIAVAIAVISLLLVICFQHGFVAASYRKQLQQEAIEEERLKARLLETVRKNRLDSDRQMAEEKNRLFQALHDRLGRSMNGSVYQLEASRLLLKHEPEKADEMLEKVIDNLRSSMDEIRAILRQERADKNVLAMQQLKGLCEDCKSSYGIDTVLKIEGEDGRIPDHIWEIILDNTFEGVSNALKYAKCTRIVIRIIVMNKRIRCTVEDNGAGSGTFTDGMGIAGMRQRMREVNGILDFETQAGFKINMLIPYEPQATV